MGNVMGVIIGILILSVMMIVHELGHYLTGRRLGFKIEEFSIFMGPVLFSWERKGIKYSIKSLPIGASVRFAGEYTEDDTPADEPGHFFNRPKWARAIVIATGPILNLFTGFLAFLLMFSIYGYTIPVIGQVSSGTLAYEAGLQVGDRVVSLNGHVIRTTLDYDSLQQFMSKDTALSLQIKSADGQLKTVVLTPRYVDKYRLGVNGNQYAGQAGFVVSYVDPESNGGNPLLKIGDTILAVNGVSFNDAANFDTVMAASAGKTLTVTILRDGVQQDLQMASTLYHDAISRGVYFQGSKDFVQAIGQSVLWCGSIVKATFRSIGLMITGDLKAQDTLSGPIGVVTIINDVVTADTSLANKILSLLWMFALISVSLGLMNLLPIPPLDGNHLLLIVIEAIRRKRLSEKAQSVIGMAGLGLIILLAAAGLIFDVMRLINR